MRINGWLGLALWACTTATVLGQIEPPLQNGEGASGLSITTPEPAAETPKAPPSATPRTGSPTAKDEGPLMSVRPNQILTEGGMIGQVNEMPIFINDVFRPLDERLKRLAQTSRTVVEFSTGARALIREQLKIMVSDALVLSAADGALAPEERSRIDDLINIERGKVISQYGGSVAAAEKALQAQGTTLAREMQSRRNAFKKEIYFARHISHNIEVTRQMTEDAYERDPKRWQRDAQIQIYTITIPVSRWLREVTTTGEAGPVIKNATPEQIKAAEVSAMATARDIVAKLKAGGDFARLAEEYNSGDVYKTKGGKWNPLIKGSLKDKKWEDYLFSLSPSSLQQPYLDHRDDYNDSAAVVIKTGEKSDAHKISLVEAQSEIVGELRQNQITDLQIKKMDELSRGAAIEAVDRNLEVAVNAAVSRYATK